MLRKILLPVRRRDGGLRPQLCRRVREAQQRPGERRRGPVQVHRLPGQAELGKVDAGGGGTVAMFMAERNIDTLDAGVPVLSMHSPFETVSKLDCYMTFKGMKAIYEAR